jgi:shikimate kinase
MQALWLVGMMGSGKTTVGRLVSRHTGLEFLDTDFLIESQQEQPIGSIWETGGEERFRDLESQQINRIAVSGEGAVVATGGGVVLRATNITTMRDCGMVVWLSAEPDELWSRVADSETRPLLLDAPDQRRLAEILKGRRRLYRAAAHFIVETGSRDAEDVAQEVAELWNGS